MTFLCVVIFIRFDFHLKNYSGFNYNNLPQETITLYNVKNDSYCGGLLETATLYFVATQISTIFETVTNINCDD